MLYIKKKEKDDFLKYFSYLSPLHNCCTSDLLPEYHKIIV